MNNWFAESESILLLDSMKCAIINRIDFDALLIQRNATTALRSLESNTREKFQISDGIPMNIYKFSETFKFFQETTSSFVQFPP